MPRVWQLKKKEGGEKKRKVESAVSFEEVRGLSYQQSESRTLGEYLGLEFFPAPLCLNKGTQLEDKTHSHRCATVCKSRKLGEQKPRRPPALFLLLRSQQKRDAPLRCPPPPPPIPGGDLHLPARCSCLSPRSLSPQPGLDCVSLPEAEPANRLWALGGACPAPPP